MPPWKGSPSNQDITFTIVQGKPETLSLSLSGDGEIVSVTGDNLRDWAIRVAKDGSRFLDIRPILPVEKGAALKSFTIRANTVSEPANGPTSLLLPGPGPATGFSLSVSLDPAAGTELRITKAEGLAPLESGTTRKFVSTTSSLLAFSVTPAGTGAHGLELFNSSLSGKLAEDSSGITFTLTATARAEASASSAELLSGNAALTTPPLRRHPPHCPQRLQGLRSHRRCRRRIPRLHRVRRPARPQGRLACSQLQAARRGRRPADTQRPA